MISPVSTPNTPVAVSSTATLVRDAAAGFAPAQLQSVVPARPRALSLHSGPGSADSSTGTSVASTPKAVSSTPVEISGRVEGGSDPIKPKKYVISVPVEANPGILAEAARDVAKWENLLPKSDSGLVSTIKKVCAYIAEAFKSFVENIKFKYQGYKAAKAAEAEAEQNRASFTAKDLGKRAGQAIAQQCPTAAEVLTSVNGLLKGFIGDLKRRLEGKEITAGFMIAELKDFRDGLESVVAQKAVNIGGAVSTYPKVSDYVMGLIVDGYEFVGDSVEGLRSTFLNYAVRFAKMGTEVFREFLSSLSEASIVKGDRLARWQQHGLTQARTELESASVAAIRKAFRGYRTRTIQRGQASQLRAAEELRQRKAAKSSAFEEQIQGMNSCIDEYEGFAKDAAEKAGRRDALARLLNGLNSVESGRTLQLLNDLRVFIPDLKNIEGAALKEKVASLLRKQEKIAQEAQEQADGCLEAILGAYRNATPSLQNGLLHRVSRLRGLFLSQLEKVRNDAADIDIGKNIGNQMRESMEKAADELETWLDSFSIEDSSSDVEEAIDAVAQDHQAKNSWSSWFGSLARGTARVAKGAVKVAAITAALGANAAVAGLAVQRAYHGV